MSWNLCGVVTQCLWGGSPTQHPLFNHAIECTQALLEFNMYAQYRSHDDATLSNTAEAFRCFPTVKDVFLLGQAGKRTKAKSNALRTELVKKRQVDEETHAAMWMPSRKPPEMNGWRD